MCEREIYSHDLNSFQGVCVCVCAPVCAWVREGLRCIVSSEVYIIVTERIGHCAIDVHAF